MAIKPLSDRVLIEPLAEKEEKIGKLYIPDTAKEKPCEGTVISVGPGKLEDRKLTEMSVKKGDVVLYSKYSGTEVKDNRKELLIVRESDILAVIN